MELYIKLTQKIIMRKKVQNIKKKEKAGYDGRWMVDGRKKSFPISLKIGTLLLQN